VLPVTRERFEELAAEAIDELPDWVRETMSNVEILIEDLPPRDQPSLLGLYHGVPLDARGQWYSGVLPDTITLYRATIVAVAGHDEDRLKREIAHTVVHEVAHHFGIDDDRLRELDAY
jgi:predicted Zn-dependent protease with MMP-like domain